MTTYTNDEIVERIQKIIAYRVTKNIKKEIDSGILSSINPVISEIVRTTVVKPKKEAVLKLIKKV